MRKSKIIAISVPPGLERKIQKRAKSEHRTVSEYVREAVRKYMALREFEAVRNRVSKDLRAKGLGPADVVAAVEEIRKKGS